LKFVDTVKSILKSPFKKMNFFITWATDQLESWFIPIYDLIYTFWFTYYLITNQRFNESEYLLLYYFHTFFIFFYLTIRFIQCIKKS